MLGVTWFAVDALGELVHFEPPAGGRGRDEGRLVRRGRVGQGRLRLIAPLSGEVIEVNQQVVDAPETVNEDPYGAGWLIRIRLSDPSEVDALLDVAAYQQVLAEQ